MREKLEAFDVPNGFKRRDGTRDETKRQRARDPLDTSKMSDSFISVRRDRGATVCGEAQLAVVLI